MPSIVTLTHNLPDWSRITIGRMREYAERIGADFAQIEMPDYKTFIDRAPYFHDALQERGRCAFIDADCVISREAPSIFDAHEAGAVWMAPDSPQNDETQACRINDMVVTQAVRGGIDWISGYGNMGVVIAEPGHAQAFLGWIDIPGTHHDQAQFNYIIRRLGYSIGMMDRKWNRMGIHVNCANQLINCERIAKDSFIAHAAGFSPADRKYAIEMFDRLLP